jgi:nicotinic acid mononucleotide adenylyltransferase
MSSILIYGGTFNPPTVAHQAAVRIGAEHADEVWVLPAYHHRFKHPDPEMMRAHFDMRMDLCRHAFGRVSVSGGAIDPVVKVLALELLNPTGATKDLVVLLKRLYPGHEFGFMIGQDAADEIQEGKWVDGLQLVKDNHFLVLSRSEDCKPAPGSWYCLPEGAFMLSKTFLFLKRWEGSGLHQVSSTAARECLGNKDFEGAAQSLPPEVLSLILEKGYYDATTDIR